MSDFAVILPAAGRSSRFQLNQRKKPFLELNGRAVWIRSAEHFVARDDVGQTIVAIAADDMEWFLEKFKPNLAFMDVEIVAGGSTRQETVQKALAHVRADFEFVAVHDAARPLLTRQWVDAIFAAARDTGAAIPATPIASTIKRVDRSGRIASTVSREGLYAAQTPQVFRREILRDAFAKSGDMSATDESQLVEQAGHAVSVIDGWPMNFKITTHDDFKMAEALIDVLPTDNRGLLHPFADEDPRFL